jgi:hypothetical protein
MATKDKHPPLDPNRHSTNKRVKPLGEQIYGTAYKEAAGAKRISPGEDNTTSAKFMGPGETGEQRTEREYAAAKKVISDEEAKQESYLSDARKKLLGQGWMRQQEKEMLTILSRRAGDPKI